MDGGGHRTAVSPSVHRSQGRPAWGTSTRVVCSVAGAVESRGDQQGAFGEAAGDGAHLMRHVVRARPPGPQIRGHIGRADRRELPYRGVSRGEGVLVIDIRRPPCIMRCKGSIMTREMVIRLGACEGRGKRTRWRRISPSRCARSSWATTNQTALPTTARQASLSTQRVETRIARESRYLEKGITCPK